MVVFKKSCSADADFSCFADLALTSPLEYFKEGEGSLLQCVLTPADKYMPMPNERIAQEVDKQVDFMIKKDSDFAGLLGESAVSFWERFGPFVVICA